MSNKNTIDLRNMKISYNHYVMTKLYIEINIFIHGDPKKFGENNRFAITISNEKL